MTKNMTKKRHSKFKLIASIAIVLLMSISMVLPALANPDPTKDYKASEGTGPGNDQAKSAITKLLKMPNDVTTPTASFTFKFTAVGVDGGTDPTGMPAIADRIITFSSADDSNPASHIFYQDKAGDYVNATDPEAATKIVVKESEDLLTGISFAPGTTWPGTGVYVYTVKEYQPPSLITPNAGAVKPDTYYSQAEYKIEFWVDEYIVLDSDGKVVSSEYYVRFVEARIVAGSIDEYHEGSQGDDKVDPTPGFWWPNKYEEIENGFSQLIFTNKYWQSDGGDGVDFEKGALYVTKTVNGAGAVLTTAFTFKVKVTQPDVITNNSSSPTNIGPQTYKAYLVGPSGIVIGGDNSAIMDATGLINFTSGTAIDVVMRHGERLIFVDLHVGSDVEVLEAANNDYSPRYKRTFAGTDEFRGTAGAPWGFGDTIGGNSGDPGPHYLPKGGGINKADFTNTRKDATPTGLDVDDLPYIVLIGVAVAGLAAFVVIKSRKRKEEYDA